MVEKIYRITTTQKTFETDNVGPDYLKENNSVFYARENKSDNWQQIKKFEQRKEASECFVDMWLELGVFWFVIFVIIVCFKIKALFGVWAGVGVVFIMPPVCVLTWLLIDVIVKKYLDMKNLFFQKLVIKK